MIASLAEPIAYDRSALYSVLLYLLIGTCGAALFAALVLFGNALYTLRRRRVPRAWRKPRGRN